MSHLRPETVLRQYRIIRVLGAGGFGVTYLAEDQKLGKLFAIKEYFPEQFARRAGASVNARSSETDNFIWGKERFMAEARTLARFSHPNIVGVAQIFEANRTAYMVLDYQQGKSFDDWLKQLGRAPTQSELDAIVTPILSALETIHRNDLLHRDIAPDNIYIRDDGVPVLLDFGSARDALAQHTKTLSAVVKSGYSPTEQYVTRGSAQGPWTDIYAFAATLYRAVTGAHPEEATDRMLSDTYVPARMAANGEYRSSFLEALDWALKVTPKERPQSIAEWRTALFAEAAAQNVPPPPPKAPAPSAPHVAGEVAAAPLPPARSRLGWLGYGGAALLAVSTLVIWLQAQNAPPAIVSAPTIPSAPAPTPAPEPSLAQRREALDNAQFANARGNLDRLRDYLAKCATCSHSGEAHAEIANIERKNEADQIQASYFNLKICNRTTYTVAIATIAREQPGTSDWHIRGWRIVEANSCVVAGRYVKGKFYAMAQVKGKSRGWFGTFKQCVEYPGPFNRIINQNSSCPDDGKQRGFSIFDVTSNDYMWEITGEPGQSDDDYFKFEVCNKSPYKVSVAISGRPDVEGGYIVKGWFGVDAGDCKELGRYAIGQFYAMAGVSGRRSLGWRGKDLKLCVKYPGPFDYAHDRPRNCPPNELESFRLITVSHGGSFKWTLNP